MTAMKYEDIKNIKYSKIKWVGTYKKTLVFRNNQFWLKRADRKINFSIAILGQEMHISIETDVPLELEELFL